MTAPHLSDLVAVEAAKVRVETIRAIFDEMCTGLPKQVRAGLAKDIDRHGDTLAALAERIRLACHDEARHVADVEEDMADRAVADAEFEAKQAAARHIELEPSSIAVPYHPMEAAE